MSIAEIFALHSEDAFRDFEKEALPRVLLRGAVVALGGGVVVDDDNWRLIRSRAVTVYLEVPFGTIWNRIHHLPGRPLIANRTRAEVESLFERRRTRYEEADFRVDGTPGASVVAGEVLKLWSG